MRPWTRLFRGYAGFYHWTKGDEHQRQICGWIHDERRIEGDDANENARLVPRR